MDEALTKLWIDLLECQVRMTLPLELPHYYAIPEWARALTVLDLGTGSGSYLSRLSRHFPEKGYVGVDSNAGYIRSATRRYSRRSGRLRFLMTDIFEFHEPAPAVIARLVAQHQRSLERFLAHVRDLVQPGGIFVSVEPADEVRAFFPELPGILNVFNAFTQQRAQEGFRRNAGHHLVELASNFGFTVTRCSVVTIPSTLPTYRSLFLTFHRLVLEIFDKAFGMTLEHERLERELSSWFHRRDSYAQLGINVAIFKRR